MLLSCKSETPMAVSSLSSVNTTPNLDPETWKISESSQQEGGCVSARHKSAVRTNLQPQFFPERFAFFEALEELIENADNDSVYADPFRFSPFPEFVAGFCADMEELRVGEFHAGLAGLHDVYLFAFNVAQSKKDDPGQIALYARLFGDCFAQINGEAQRHSRTVVRPPLPLAVHFPRRLLRCLLDCHWMPFQSCLQVAVEAHSLLSSVSKDR